MAYSLHKEETPHLRTAIVKSNEQTCEKTLLLSRAQPTSQVCAVNRDPYFPQARQKVCNYRIYRAASPHTPRKQRNGGKYKRGIG